MLHSAETLQNHLHPSAHLCEAELSTRVPLLCGASGAHAQRSRSHTAERFFGCFGPWQRSVTCRPPDSHPLGGPPRSIRAMNGVKVCRGVGDTRRLQCRGMLCFWLEHGFGTGKGRGGGEAMGFAVGFAGRLAGLAVRLAGGFWELPEASTGLPWPAPLRQAAPGSPAGSGLRGWSGGGMGTAVAWLGPGDLPSCSDAAVASPAPLPGWGGTRHPQELCAGSGTALAAPPPRLSGAQGWAG